MKKEKKVAARVDLMVAIPVLIQLPVPSLLLYYS